MYKIVQIANYKEFYLLKDGVSDKSAKFCRKFFNNNSVKKLISGIYVVCKTSTFSIREFKASTRRWWLSHKHFAEQAFDQIVWWLAIRRSAKRKQHNTRFHSTALEALRPPNCTSGNGETVSAPFFLHKCLLFQSGVRWHRPRHLGRSAAEWDILFKAGD